MQCLENKKQKKMEPQNSFTNQADSGVTLNKLREELGFIKKK
jgi:hypothetical protein